jgi:16S rRNA (cytosine1402-N4)-methyltransferase
MHQNKNQNKNKQHVPVLLTEVIELLDPRSGDSYLDLTAGYGGHAEAIIALTGKPERAVLVDRDENAILELQKMGEFKQACIINQDFFTASKDLSEENKQFDLILADLGVSSPHLNEGERGFSIQHDGPLDMRMDQGQSLTADKILNTYSKDDIVSILRDYGQEPKANRIAEAIIAHRPLTMTSQLASLVTDIWRGNSRIHPATRTFQALRIAVNDELGLLSSSLPIWLKLLKPGGRLGVISFHSLEDRIVKQFYMEHGGDTYDATIKLLTKHPIRAGPNETVNNPRARSAKLRVAVKIKT